MKPTQREIAAELGVSQPAFSKFLGKHPEACEALENGIDIGKASLRRMMFAMAPNSATLMIFMACSILGFENNYRRPRVQPPVDGGDEDGLSGSEQLNRRIDQFGAAVRAALANQKALSRGGDAGPDGEGLEVSSPGKATRPAG